jgi:hypothetical protein
MLMRPMIQLRQQTQPRQPRMRIHGSLVGPSAIQDAIGGYARFGGCARIERRAAMQPVLPSRNAVQNT